MYLKSRWLSQSHISRYRRTTDMYKVARLNLLSSLLPTIHTWFLRTLLVTAPVVDLAKVTRSRWVVVGGSWHFACELFKGFPFCFWNKKCGNGTAQHEKRKDLHDVVEPWRGSRAWRGTTLAKRAEHALGNNGTEFARGGGDTVRARAVASREAFTRDNESGCVRA